ncbi:MAG: HlyD family efflux transporter periplasmic adaptor subunit [Calothrix sp. C42_A2020_038]|nr:HlyD family efflux transporter periplasmic adaptor subunit [Calothrix sp. C42_A2020_038]
MTQVAPSTEKKSLPGSNTDSEVLNSKPKPNKKPIKLLLAILVLLAGVIGYAVWRTQPRVTADTLRVSGRIEGYETEIGVKRSGRVESITVREGAAVKKGQQLIKLDDSNDLILSEQLRGAQARVALAQSDEQQAQSDVLSVMSQIEQVESQISEAQLNVQQSQGDTQGRIQQAQASVAAASSQLVQVEAQAKQTASEVKLAKINLDRYQKLVADGAINKQQFDQAQTTYDTAVATLEARKAAINSAREQLSAAEGGLMQTQTTAFNPGIRNAQLQALYRKRAQTQAQLKSAQARVKSAQAKVKDALASQQQIVTQINDSKRDLNVVSPLDGVVTARSVEPGAVVNNQTKILTIVDPKTIYLRGFIPEGDIGKIRIGQITRIFLDSAPKNPLNGKVISIDPQASFTPENIYFQKDRVRQVVGVRISVDNPDGCFNPNSPYAGADLPCARIGMPADADILLKAK